MTELKCPALYKRAEQLKRWLESETNAQSPLPKSSARIRFSVDCVFLAACAAGDKDEVLRLVRNGADVNTPSVDGLTALHQACIDNKIHMVEFLLKLGANVNHSDNEGWTPLHATASCGFYEIAQFLLDHGANLCAVNNEGELPVDLAEPGPALDFLTREIQKQGIDCEKARTEEERLLLEHAKKWYISSSKSAEALEAELPDPKTGATPLHIAAAKGYLEVMQILLNNCCVEVDPVDLDGWTPLHASAHWGQKEAASVLIQHGADMNIKNFVGQTCFDVASQSMVEHLQDLKDRYENIPLSTHNKSKRRPPVPEDLPAKLKKVEVQIDNKFDSNNVANNKKTVEKKNALNLNSFPSPVEGKPPKIGGGTSSPMSPNESPLPEDEPSWRHSSRQKPQPSSINDKESPTNQPENDIILRRTPSDLDKLSPQTKIKKEVLPPTNPSTARSMLDSSNDQSENSKNSSSDPPTTKIFPGNIFKNFFKSFVPPVRDEESETQRKAHAKRVRETRRSTQGVTLDEIKSAEQLVKKKNSVQSDKNDLEVTIKKDLSMVETENNQKDQNHKEEIRDADKSNNSGEPVDTETTVTIALPRNSPVKKEEEKESESRVTTQAAQNVIQRRKRPKRRSTGVVNVDLDEITPDQSAGEGTESGSESTELSEAETSQTKTVEDENEADYKALWEKSEQENKKLQETVANFQKELADAKQKIEEYSSRLALASDNEKREKKEKRTMERKMSEMEEELKCLHDLQTENKRLKDDNGALIRVISKLSK